MIRPTRTSPEHALFVAKKIHARLVYDMAAHEGNPLTFPEIQTLLEGITVGGRRIEDQDQALRISKGWKCVIRWIEDGAFRLSMETAIHLNTIVARGEALETGRLRSGGVGIQGTNYRPPPPETLETRFRQLIEETERAALPESAYRYFLAAAANQFFWDGNKRTALLLMNALLLRDGFLPVSIPAGRHLDYNRKMLRYYETADPSEMIGFLADCAAEIAAPFWPVATSAPGETF